MSHCWIKLMKSRPSKTSSIMDYGGGVMLRRLERDDTS